MTTKMTGTILTITIDLSKKGSLSQSRKSFLVATTHGAMQVGTPAMPCSLNLNAYVPDPAYVPTPEEVALKAAQKAMRRG